MPPHRAAKFRPGPEISLSKVNFSLWKASTMGTPPRTRLTNRASYPIYDAWRGWAGFFPPPNRIPFGGWSRPLGEGWKMGIISSTGIWRRRELERLCVCVMGRSHMWWWLGFGFRNGCEDCWFRFPDTWWSSLKSYQSNSKSFMKMLEIIKLTS